MNEERSWAEDTVRMGQTAPSEPKMSIDVARRRRPLPSRRTAAEVAVGLVALIALLGAKGGGDPGTSAGRVGRPASTIAKPPRESVSQSRRKVKQEAISTFRRQRRHRDNVREQRHRRRGAPSSAARRSPEAQPAPPPAAVEAPPETAVYPKQAPESPAPATEPPPPTPTDAEFGM
jgi:hypothetical protein